MKFSLKHLIVFVTFAAILCGVVSFAYNRVRVAQLMANQAKAEAERYRVMYLANLDIEPRGIKNLSVASIFREYAASLQDLEHSILHWNIESGGNDPETIASQLIGLGRYDIIGLSEVAHPKVYEQAISMNWPDRYAYIRGNTGRSDKLLMFYDKKKFELVESADMQEAGGVVLNNGRRRAPLYARFKNQNKGQELIVILNHLARGDAEFRQQQAAGLREWARNKAVAIIAIGEYNFDYDFNTQKGNAGFDEFLRDGVWKWIKPVEMIDTSWSDDNGKDRYPDSMLDFIFVAGGAKDWKAECRVIVRDGDFPDDEKTSDHRPVELILTEIKQ